MGENALCAISHVVQIFSIITIGRYDPSHSSRPILCPTWPDHSLWNASWQSCQQLKNYPSALASYAFDDPSPAAFEGALATFMLATLYLHTFYRQDRYENRHLVAGIVAAASISSTIYFMLFDEHLAHSIQICLPTTIMVASMGSAIFHRMESWATSRQQDHQGEQRKEALAGGQESGEKQGS